MGWTHNDPPKYVAQPNGSNKQNIRSLSLDFSDDQGETDYSLPLSHSFILDFSNDTRLDYYFSLFHSILLLL